MKLKPKDGDDSASKDEGALAFEWLYDKLLDQISTKLSVKVDRKTLAELAWMEIELSDAFYGPVTKFYGMVPKEVLEWIDFGRRMFWVDTELQHLLDNLEYRFLNNVYPDLSVAALEKVPMKIKSGKSYRTLTFDERIRCHSEEIRKIVPLDRLRLPVGKGIRRRRLRKVFDPSKQALTKEEVKGAGKHWKIVRDTIYKQYNLLKPFYEKRRYPERLLQDILRLMEKFSPLRDLNRNDIISVIEDRSGSKRD